MKHFPRLSQSDGPPGTTRGSRDVRPVPASNCVAVGGYLIVNEFVEENILHLHTGTSHGNQNRNGLSSHGQNKPRGSFCHILALKEKEPVVGIHEITNCGK